jgi:hypothetical protein
MRRFGLSLFRSFLLLVVAGTLSGVSSALTAQTITVQVVDGHTGRPLPASAIRVDCTASTGDCPGISELKPLLKARPGAIALPVPANATALWVDAADDEHAVCGAAGNPNATTFSVPAIRSTGLIGSEHCGRIAPAALRRWQPQPGRLVVFVTRRSGWRKLLPYC